MFKHVLLAFCLAISACGPGAAEGPKQSSEGEASLTEKLEAGDYGAVTSLWIEVDGSVVYEAYFRGADASTLHNTRSVGKTVTGMLLGAAIDDGLVENVEVKAASFFPELMPFANPDMRKNNINLKDLLTMSGPLECNDWNSFSRGNEERMYLVEDWSEFFWSLPIKNRPSWEIPENDGGFGRLYSYCTAGAQLVGEIVERVAEQPMEEYAQQRLFGPLGITHPKWNYASSGKAHLGGGLELKTADWARLARLMATGGVHEGEQLLSKAWIDASLKNYVLVEPGTGYGYFWWRPELELDGQTHAANMMSGSGGNRIYVMPEKGLVAVITKNDFRDRGAHASSEALFENEVLSFIKN